MERFATRLGNLAKALLLLATGFQILVLAQLAGYPYWPEQVVLPGNAEVGLFMMLTPLSPILIVFLLYGRLLGLPARRVTCHSEKLRAPFSWLPGPLRPLLTRIRFFDLAKASSIKILDRPLLLLAAGIIGSGFLASLPYWPFWNSSGSLLGIDSRLYQQWLIDMRIKSLDGAVTYAFSEAEFGSRALLLIPAYFLGQLAGAQPAQVVTALPFVLGPLLALSVFQFAKAARAGGRAAGLAALITPFSFNITVGIWGAYYANWLALAEAYLFLSVLAGFQRRSSFSKYVSLTTLSLVILMTHPWTWVLVLTVALAFTASLRGKPHKVSQKGYVVIVILIGVIADLIKNSIFAVRTIAQDLATKAPVAGFQELVSFWGNLIDALLYTHGGLMANAVVLGLAAAGVMTLKWKESFQRLLITWTVVAAVAMPFFDSYHQSRIIYDMPIPLLSTVGLIFVASQKKGRGIWPSLVVLLGVLVTASYMVWAYSIS